MRIGRRSAAACCGRAFASSLRARFLGALFLVAAPLAVGAQELSNLRWLESEEPVFEISAPSGIEYSTETLDNGYRLRVSFPGASLSRSIRDIGEAGIVRGVFPYETDSPDRANFDILLKAAGALRVVPVDGGYRVAIVEGGGSAASADMADTAAPEAGAALVARDSVAAPEAEPAEREDPGPYAGMTDLERQVLQEIEDSNQPMAEASQPDTQSAADSGAAVAGSQQTSQVQESQSGQRARVVLPASAPQPQAPLADNAPEQEAPQAPPEPAASAVVEQSSSEPATPAPPSTPPTEPEAPPAPVAASAAPTTQDAASPPSVADSVNLEVQYPQSSAEVPPPPLVTASETPPVTAQPMAPGSSRGATAGDAEAMTGGAPMLNAITYSELPGGRLQVNFNLSGQFMEPGVFRTNNPPRIVLDFFDTSNGVADDIQRVAFGALESIVTAQNDDRTRVVLNLVAPVDFEQRQFGNGVALVMASPTDSQVAASARRARPAFQSASAPGFEFSVSDVDFRRTPEGGGKVTVSLSSDEIGIDVREEAGEIVIDFPGTNLPPELEKRLDVVDFATPVQTIDTFFTGAGARMIVSPVGEYSYSSYQVGDTLTLQVSPITADEQEREPDEFGYVGDRLSFNFQRISVRAALQVIADFTGLNFVTSDSVSGDLSLRLQDVPWDQALDTILQVKGLAKRQRGNVVWVAPAEEIAAKERQALEAQNQVSELEPLVSELIQINYAKADDIAAILKSVRAVDTGFETSLFGSVSISEIETESNSLLSARGNVTVDSRTNTILVQDTRSKIREIRKLIAELDRPVRQVLIETRIVEANDDFSRNIGARLGFTRVTENARFPGVNDSNIGTAIGSASIEDNDAIIAGGNLSDRSGVSVDLPASGTGTANAASYAFTLAKAGSGFSHLIDLEISALEAEGTGKVIANPRLLTTDQNEARIEQGQERVFTTSVLGEGGVVTKKAVLGLTVTPQITPDDRLVLDVFVTKDTFAPTDDATILTKQVRTKVLLDNGETVVIGGIYEQAQSETTTKVPLLGDIPLLGALFRKRNKFDNRTELLIFLTPRILDPALTLN